MTDKPVNIVDRIPAADFTASHTLATKFEVLAGVDAEVVAELETVTDATVTLDAQASSRGRLSMTVVDDGYMDLVPISSTSLLAPFGHEVRVSRGIEYSNRIDLVRLGVFVIEQSSTSDSPEGVAISVSGPDRSGDIIDAAFEKPYTLPSGTEIGDGIRTLVHEVNPLIVCDFLETTVTTPAIFAEEGEDRWAFCQGLATSIGAQLYFDGEGVLKLEPIVFPGGAPSAVVQEGDGGILLGADRDWDRAPVFNKVIVNGETPAGDPVRGEATDSNPQSPTYYGGDFGKKPRFWANSYVTTEPECQNAAAGLLAEVIGAPDTIAFQSVVNPNFLPNTLLRITRERLGLDEDHVLDDVSIPCTAEGQMSGRTRAVALSIGV